MVWSPGTTRSGSIPPLEGVSLGYELAKESTRLTVNPTPVLERPQIMPCGVASPSASQRSIYYIIISYIVYRKSYTVYSI